MEPFLGTVGSLQLAGERQSRLNLRKSDGQTNESIKGVMEKEKKEEEGVRSKQILSCGTELIATDLIFL